MSDMVGIDPLAIEITKEINDANIKAQEKRCVTWEHEELAQVNSNITGYYYYWMRTVIYQLVT